MAQSRVSGDTPAVKLRSFRSSKGCLGHYVYGKHLSVENVDSILDNNVSSLNDSGLIMRERLQNAKPHDFQLTRVPFPITNLQHVTDETSVCAICDLEGFRAHRQGERVEFRNLLFWSAHVASDTITQASQEAFQKLLSRNIPNVCDYKEEILKQSANSPAFTTASSYYGNLRFSFPLSDLLSWYGEQFCEGRKPRLRILGTELYKQEISHVIVLHSPDTRQFNELPEVPTLQDFSEPLPFAFWKDNIFFWYPESTSGALKVKISERGIDDTCFMPCSGYQDSGSCDHSTFCVWNHLVFAFHLPYQHLRVPVEKLLGNVTACYKESLNSTAECQTPSRQKKSAEILIRQLKREKLQ